MTHWHRILVTGSREWDEPTAVYIALHERLMEHGRITVVHGDCPTGADRHARQWAEARILEGMRLGEAYIRHEAYPAPWEEFDKSAGPMRNKYMTQLEADECLAFPTPSSRGTVSCMKFAQGAGIPIDMLGTMPLKVAT